MRTSQQWGPFVELEDSLRVHIPLVYTAELKAQRGLGAEPQEVGQSGSCATSPA